MVKYVIVDTNVIVSAMLKGNSAPRNIIDMIDIGLLIPLFSKEIFDEYIEVLSRKKFNFSRLIIENMLCMFRQRGKLLFAKKYDGFFIDESDKKFYEILLAFKENYNPYLITGNIKHFPKDEKILSPREFLEELNK